MENVTIKHDGQEYSIDRETLEKCKVIPKPTWDRMEVLRGEWKPKYGDAYFFIMPYSTEIRGECRNGLRYPKWSDGFVFFPTRELAEEYLLIAEGKWLPKRGDYYCMIEPDGSLYGVIASLSGKNSADLALGYRFFPSLKQRDEYIAKKKSERPLAGKEAIIDGVTYKLQ